MDIKKAVKETGGYLHTEEGKRLLREARLCGVSWPRMVSMFKRSKSTIEKAFSYHGIRTPRTKFLNWNDSLLNLVRRFYRRSQKLSGLQGSARLTGEMLVAVNEARAREGLPPTTLNAIRCFANANQLRWGWHTRMNSGEKSVPTRISAEDREYLKHILPGTSSWSGQRG